MFFEKENNHQFCAEAMRDIFLSISNCLSDREVSKVYNIPYPTVSKWKNLDMEHFKNRYKIYLIEFLRRFDQEKTKEIIEKYKLPRNVNLKLVSGTTQIPYRVLESFESSKAKWKTFFYQILMEHNQELFELQYELVKKSAEKKYLMKKKEQKQNEV